jgi:hypothetical protein
LAQPAALSATVRGGLIAVALLCGQASAGGGALASDRPANGSPRDLLPNLVAADPFQIYESNCDAYEQTEEGARRCLRYDTVVLNLGRGPLELRYRADQIGRDEQIRQRIYAGDGGYSERVVGRYEVHPTHAHFHYANFALARLWRANRRGERIGAHPIRVSNKAGFCLTDSDNYWAGSKRSRPRAYEYPEACWPAYQEGTEVAQVNGLSSGWMDVYDARLSDQYVEITGVPDGYYLLEVVIDPLGALVETTRADNSSLSFIFIRDSDTTELSVRILKPEREPASRSRRMEHDVRWTSPR